MKGKRWILAAVLIAVILIGWLSAVRSASGIASKKEQKRLETQADLFKEKELYIRALPLYEKALKYDTKSNAKIEKKMLQIYRAQQDVPAYEELVEKRAEKGTASEAEYVQAAKYYLEDNDLKEAMELLEKGMKDYPEGKLEELYEANRYGYSLRPVEAQKILPTEGNQMMPACADGKWGYVNESGSFVLPAVYESAVPFNSGGLAAVSLDGTYYTIIPTGEKYGVDETGLTDVFRLNGNYIIGQKDQKYGYYTMDFERAGDQVQADEITLNSCGVIAVRKGEKWAIAENDGKAVTDFIFDDVAVNSLGQVFSADRGFVKKDGLWYLVNPEGKKILETGYADAKAPESDGYLAVADKNGKWGFINAEGEQVIDYEYHDAFSFSNHLAAVKKIDTWGYISEKNELVIQEKLDEAMPFHQYISQCTYLGQAALIRLEYRK